MRRTPSGTTGDQLTVHSHVQTTRLLRQSLFRGEPNITSDIEMIRMDRINEAYERMLKSDVNTAS